MPLLAALVRRRTVWWPTWLGWMLLFLTGALPLALWVFCGERFLCANEPAPSQILVVEGWVGTETLDAAAHEFSSGRYVWVVTAGGPNGEPWNSRRWTYAEIAADGLAAAGISRSKIISAPAQDVQVHRTYESALAVQQVLAARQLTADSITVFTRGSHGRRSRLVYQKVFGPGTNIAVISWLPDAARSGPWWRSTVRAEDLLTETFGYAYEALLSSGRERHRSVP